MVAFRFRLDQRAVDEIARKAALKLVTNATRETLNRAKVLTPVRFGHLRLANDMRVLVDRRGVVGEVFNDLEYAKAVHDGTPPHDIRPRVKKALRFKGTAKGKGKGKGKAKGGWVFARVVHHPGTKARPWLLTALREIATKHGFRVDT
jgi:hypothetical protein